MSLKAKIEAIVYASEEPVTVEQIAGVLKDSLPDTETFAAHKETVRGILNELAGDYASSERGMEIRQVANGYRISTKPEHHDVVRSFARSLKPPIRLSLQ